LALGVAFAAPASADPATQGSASAFGTRIAAGGLGAVPATPSVSVGTPGVQEQTAVPADIAPLVVNGTLRTRAECQVESAVAATLANQGPNNCRGFAITESLDVLLGATGTATSLVSARVIEGEAVARCVGGRGQVATGFNLLGLQVAGQDLGTPLTNTLEPVLNLTAPGGALANVVQIARNEIVNLPGGGIAVNALHIRILPITGTGTVLPGLPLPTGMTLSEAVDIVISHAEARMPTPCGVPAASQALGTGPETSGSLPRTGDNRMLAVPLALGLLTTALVLRQVNSRVRQPSV